MRRVHENISEQANQNKIQYRDRIDLLGSRVELLSGKDRLLMEMYVNNGNTFRQMARLMEVNEVTVARRIHRLIKRLIDGEYIFCLRNRERFSDDEMEIARCYFLRGLAMKKIARETGISYYRVRQVLKKIQAIVKVNSV